MRATPAYAILAQAMAAGSDCAQYMTAYPSSQMPAASVIRNNVRLVTESRSCSGTDSLSHSVERAVRAIGTA